METNPRILLLGLLYFLLFHGTCDSSNECKSCELNISKVDITYDAKVNDKLAELACVHWKSAKKKKKFSLKSGKDFFSIKDNVLYLKSTEKCPTELTLKCSSVEMKLGVNCAMGVKSQSEKDGEVTTESGVMSDGTTVVENSSHSAAKRSVTDDWETCPITVLPERITITDKLTTPPTPDSFTQDNEEGLNTVKTEATTGRFKHYPCDPITTGLKYLAYLTGTIRSGNLRQTELLRPIQDYLLRISTLFDVSPEELTEYTEKSGLSAAMSLAQGLDLFQEAVLEAGNFSSPQVIATGNTATIIESITAGDENSTTFQIASYRHGHNSITFPADLIPGELVVTVAATVYRSSGLNSTSGGKMVSDVVSIVTNPKTPPHLKQPIELTLPKQDTDENATKRNYQCTFLDFNTFSWSESGCHVQQSNLSHVTCHCSHLTSFAILMQDVDIDITAELVHLANITGKIKSGNLKEGELQALIPDYLLRVSTLLDVSPEELTEYTEKSGLSAAMSLAQGLDLFQEAVLEAGNFSSPLVTSTNNTVTTIEPITASGENSTAIQIVSPHHGSTSITFPADLISGELALKVAATVYRSPGLNSTSGGKMVSHVVSIVTNPKTPPHLKQPIELTLPKQDTDEKATKRIYLCTFLDFNTSSWSESGCHVQHSNFSHVTCHCSHLTSFAILMQVVDIDIPAEDHRVLETLTTIGSSVSLLSITITLAVIIWLRQFTDRLLILINLMLALGLAQAMFLAGVQATYDTTLCKIVAVLLHYLYLAVFSLMLAEGIQLYQKLYHAMSDGMRIRYLLISAWGCPGIIVAVTLGLRVEDYGTSKSCWLSLNHGTIWAFVGPALFVILVNVIVLCLVLKVYLSVRINAKKSQFAKIRSSLKTALVLLPLIGLPWVFGVLAMSTSTIVFQYFFAILNSLQGFFIFLFHVVLNADLKDSFKRKAEKMSSSTSSKMNFSKQNIVTPLPDETAD